VLVPKYPNVMDAAALTAKYACKSNENFVYLKTFSVIYKFHLFQVLSNYAYVEMQCRKTSWTRTLTFFADNHRGNYSNLRCNLELENKYYERWYTDVSHLVNPHNLLNYKFWTDVSNTMNRGRVEDG